MSQDSNKLFKAIIDEYIESGCPGVILEVSAPVERLSFSGASGFFQRDHNRPLSVNDSFRAASVTKAVTAVTAVLMAAMKIWKLDDPVIYYLSPEEYELINSIEGLEDVNDLTIRRLLNHTSGLPDYFFNPVFRKIAEKKPDHVWQPIELLKIALEKSEPFFTPGEGFSYGDTAYVLTGIAMENILKCSLADAYRSFIFDPLGMESTYLEWHEEPLTENLSHHYDGEKDLYYSNYSFDWAGGGLVTTAGDLTRFLKGLYGKSLFDEDWLNQITECNTKTRGLPSSSASYIRYGLGVGKNIADGEEIIGVTGVWGAFAYYWLAGLTTITGTLNLVGIDRTEFVGTVINTIKRLSSME